MTQGVRDWLPSGMASGDLARPKLQAVVDAWSAYWFCQRGYGISRLTERTVALPGDDGWQVYGQVVAMRCPRTSASRLVETALDLRSGPGALTERDAKLLDCFGEAILDDLAVRMERILDLSQGTHQGETAGRGRLEIAVAEGAGPDLLILSLPIFALTALVRQAVGPRSAGAPLGALIKPFADIDVALEATLGRVEISMPDLAALAPGDVLVLSTTIDTPIDVCLRGSNHILAYARLAETDGEVALALLQPN